MSEFKAAAALVRQNIDKLAEGELYVLDVSGDKVWESYIGAFPPGTNDIYRERRAHDCSACRQFIRAMGNVVSITEDNTIRTIWEVEGAPAPYDTVFDRLDQWLKGFPVQTVFYHDTKKVGVEYNFEEVDGCEALRWDHFSCELPGRLVTQDVRQKQGEQEGNLKVIQRGFEEITSEAVDMVIELCENNSLYRGQQSIKALQDFKEARRYYFLEYRELRRNLAWKLSTNARLKIRNTSIGTLLVDLSGGRDLEDSVRAYERLVAPGNYRRSSSLITKAMVDKALTKVSELGLEGALARRYATAADLSVSNVIYVNRSTRPVMKGAMDELRDDLLAQTPGKFKPNPNTLAIGIDHFLDNVLPGATKVEILVERGHIGNLASLTAPVDESAPSMFSWGDGIAWSYRGNITDSIKERVKRAGGSVTGYARVSLSWGNTDDLDIHVKEPDGVHIYYGNDRPRGNYTSLDVDANAGGSRRTDPVENITWPSKQAFKPGPRRVWVHQYAKRNSDNFGFDVEIEIDGQSQQFSYDRPMPTGKDVEICSIQTSSIGESVVKTGEEVSVGSTQSEEWGLKTGEMHEVEMVVLSPNYWGDARTGNKHWFFILKDCKNPDPTRGIYNEFLRSDLLEHRKVFEMVGAKTMCPVTAERQLSGLGFSVTIPNHFVVRVDNNMYRVEI